MLKVIKLAISVLVIGGLLATGTVLAQQTANPTFSHNSICGLFVAFSITLIATLHVIAHAFIAALAFCMPAIDAAEKPYRHVYRRYHGWCTRQDAKVETALDRFDRWFDNAFFAPINRWTDAAVWWVRELRCRAHDMMQPKLKVIKSTASKLQHHLDNDGKSRKKVVLYCCPADTSNSDYLAALLTYLAESMPDVQFIRAPKPDTYVEPGPLFLLQVSVPAGKVQHYPIVLKDRLLTQDTLQPERSSLPLHAELLAVLKQRLLQLDAQLTAQLHRLDFKHNNQVVNPVKETADFAVKTLLLDPEVRRAVVYFCREEGDERSLVTKHFDHVASAMRNDATFVRSRWFSDPKVCRKCQLDEAQLKAGEEDYRVRMEQLRNYPPHYLIQSRIPGTDLVERKLVCGKLNFRQLEAVLASTFSEFNTRLEARVSQLQPVDAANEASSEDAIA